MYLDLVIFAVFVFVYSTVAEAIECAYSAVDRIDWKGVHFRKDIGKKALNR